MCVISRGTCKSTYLLHPTALFFKSMSKLQDLLRERLAADIPAKAKNGQGKGP